MMLTANREGGSDILAKRFVPVDEAPNPKPNDSYFQEAGPVSFFTHSIRKFVLGSVLAGALLSSAQTQKNWKDQAEYDLYMQIMKATVPDQQLQMLNQWSEKYPESEYKLERAQTYLVIYSKKNDPAGLYGSCKNLLALDPKSFQALYFLTLLTVSLSKTDAESLDTGIRSANGLMSALDATYDLSKKPATTTEAQWKQSRIDIEAQAIKTLGWVEWQKKNYPAAEKHFLKALELTPGNAELSYFLGTMIALQKDPKRQAAALWHFARAGNLEGPGALDATRKVQVAKYFERVFTSFAGDDKKDMNEVIEKAKANVMPPADFTIKSKEEKMLENAEKFKSENPMLYQYMEIKKALVAADGDAYWGNLKDAELPAFKGKLVSAKPETNPKEIVVAVETADQPEVTLVLEKPLRGKADAGTEIEFVGVAKEFTKSPFTMKLEVENEKLRGWPAAVAPVKSPKAAPAKKAGAPAKKAAKK
jgi:tetratricopeptide (TPR) repeat protein